MHSALLISGYEKETGALLFLGEGNRYSTVPKRRKLVLYCFQENKSGAPSCLQEKGTGALLISGERNWCSTVFRRRKLVLYSFHEKGTGALSTTVLMIGEGN